MVKRIFICTLLSTILCFSLSYIASKGSDNSKGFSVSEGYMEDGKLVITDSDIGIIGGNPEKSEELSEGANIFKHVGEFSGIICIASFVIIYKNKKARKGIKDDNQIW